MSIHMNDNSIVENQELYREIMQMFNLNAHIEEEMSTQQINEIL